MAALLTIGVLLWAAGFALMANLFGSADLVIGRITSRSLGSLAPGYAASRRGFLFYSMLVLDVGVVCAGLGITGWSQWPGVGLAGTGGLLFVIDSVVVVAGEVRTYRRLKR